MLSQRCFIAGCCCFKHQHRPYHNAFCRKMVSTASCAAPATPLTLQQYDDFEFLWLAYRHGLSISKESALDVLQHAQLGLLPADAELLRARAQQFAGWRRQVPRLDTLRVLNSSTAQVLSQDSGQLQQSVLKLLQMIPGACPTDLVLDTVAELSQLPAEVIALQYHELGLLFQTALGTHITGKPFHYLLEQLQLQQQLQQEQQQHLQHEQHELPQQLQLQDREATGPTEAQLPATQQSAVPLTSFAAILDQLDALKLLLGADLAHAALSNTPQLLSAPTQRISSNLQWLQWRLRLSPAAVMLLAEQQGDLLLLAPAQLQSNYSNLCYLLQQLLGWRLQQVHTLLYNAPQLLVLDSKQLAGNWQRVQQCCKRRLVWARELAAAGPALVTAVLCCQPQQLLMLRYGADTGDLRGKSLINVLADVDYVDFLAACPGFRVWRSMGPGRWRFAAAAAAAAAADAARGDTAAAADAAGAAFVDEAVVVQQRQDNSGSSGSNADGSRQRQGRRVLAVDKLNRPILVQVGERGPYDRLM